METSRSEPPSVNIAVIKSIAILCLQVACGVIIGWVFVLTFVDPIFQEAESLWPLILAFVPISYLVVLTHELGHVVGGWLTGHRFHLLTVGPIRVNRGLRIDIEWNGNTLLAGGLAICFPQRLDHLRMRRFVFIAMGPLSSLALTALCWFLSEVLVSDPLPSACWMMGAAVSSMITLVTILPFDAGGFQSDGAQMLSLLRDDAKSKKATLFCVLQNLSTIGERPRDWDPELLAETATEPETYATLDSTIDFFAYLHTLDSGRVAEAREHLNDAMNRFKDLPKGIRQGFALEAAFFAAMYEEDLEVAEAWHAKGKGGLVDAASRARVDAAMMMLRKEPDEARSSIEKARELLLTSFDLGSVELQREWLAEIERRLPTPAAPKPDRA
ncbi:MAG: hypothetical protein AAGG48_23090 [Planctomycetota bacterium]